VLVFIFIRFLSFFFSFSFSYSFFINLFLFFRTLRTDFDRSSFDREVLLWPRELGALRTFLSPLSREKKAKKCKKEKKKRDSKKNGETKLLYLKYLHGDKGVR
jgi:hypothetical protein